MASHPKPTPVTGAKSALSGNSAPGPTSWASHPLTLAVLLVLLVVAAYLPALRGGFIWDDDAYVTQNPMLTDSHGLREIWFSAHTQSQYFPLVYTTLRFEYGLWGLNPFGYHLVNVLLHGCNAVLVWVVLRRLFVPGAWLAAAIFALHPVQVESVAWVTELKNLESLFFYLLAVLAWIKFLGPLDSTRWRYYGLALGCALLALFAKTTACTLPAALVLVLWLRGERLAWSRAFQVAPFLLIGLGMGFVTVWWEGHLGNFDEGIGVAFGPLVRMLVAGRALWFYAAKLVWPVALTFSYPRWEINPAQPWQYLPVAGCLAVAAMVWAWHKKIGRGPVAGLAFFVAALSPLIGFIWEYTFHYSYVADHYQYNASIGLIAICAAGICRVFAKSGVLLPVQGILLGVLGYLTWQQCGAYRNLETLWQDTLSKNPGSWMAHDNLGNMLFVQGRLDEALEHYQAAVALHPGGDVEQGDLGAALLEKGVNSEAIRHLESALAINPKLFPAQNNLALAYANIGDYDHSVAHFKTALQIRPDDMGTLLNLGSVLLRQGKRDDAIQCYRQAALQHPAEVVPWRRLAAALAANGRTSEAVATYRQALQYTPTNVSLLLDLGNACLAQNNYVDAADSYRKALKADPDNAGLHYNLGVTLGLLGNPAAERQELQAALQLKPDFSAAMQQLLRLAAQSTN